MIKKAGFTLIEALLLVVIIGVIASIVIPNVVDSRQRAQEQACRANMSALVSAIQVFKIENPGQANNITKVGVAPQFAIEAANPAAPTEPEFDAAINCPQDGSGYTIDPATGAVTCPNGHTLS